MQRIILRNGAIAGLIAITAIIIGLTTSVAVIIGDYQQTAGYLFMLLALSLVFVGVKHYRDQELGGTISFGNAFLVGIGISAVAGVTYVAVWEAYLALTDYAYISEYTSAIVAAREADGVTGDELAAVVADMEEMKAMYGNPIVRVPMTFIEIFPVGLVISLISAAVLRNSKVLPASG